MTGYEVCKIWCATKAHYTSDYDVLKYNWSFNLSEETFRARKDRFTFERLAKEYENEATFKQAVGYYLYDNPKGYIRGLIRPNKSVDDAIYRVERLYDNFRLDYLTIRNNPPLIERLLDCSISPEGACMYLDYFEMFKYGMPEPFNTKIRVTALLPKYNAFIGYDRGKVAAIVNSIA